MLVREHARALHDADPWESYGRSIPRWRRFAERMRVCDGEALLGVG